MKTVVSLSIHDRKERVTICNLKVNGLVVQVLLRNDDVDELSRKGFFKTKNKDRISQV